MSLWLRVALAVFATWRVTHLLAGEDGPGDIVYRLRARLGPSFAGKLMDCFYCLSLWVAAPFALLVTRQLLDGILTWLAISGAACLLELATQKRAELRPPQIEGEEKHALLRSEERDPANHISGYQR